MKIAGITKVRNEADIIDLTLDWYAKFCNAGIYVYDDCSEDNTVDVCKRHPFVSSVIEGKIWHYDRTIAEYQTRQVVLERAKLDKPDWFIYFDADEFIDFEIDFDILKKVDAINMKLFDFYITEEDKDKHFLERQFIGPEYRIIVMMFKNSEYLRYDSPDQREVHLPPNAKIITEGFVRHYGKAISVKRWEKKCQYYEDYFPEPYKTKWKNRKGKCIKQWKYLSDFNYPLIKWQDRFSGGIELTPAIEKAVLPKHL